ncbi:lactonase family protein [Actinomadura sp. ATCC 31491]|uniref:Lactonase family protein n=1 Tax=Actinomadura luzonensis TaxID=2805427 RepID=A0ABT0G131_9ACTN|nr:beta-propeller fold lactonase family protein [Actinomadura luzonensis]MCK2218275.1 lactonase family protein [Actinomadura luzonensis]
MRSTRPPRLPAARGPRLALAAAAASVLLTGTPAGAAAGDGTLYVTNGDSGDISLFRLGPAGEPALEPPLIPTGPQPRQLQFSGDGRTAYVATALDDSVHQYRVGDDGRLTPLTPPAVRAGDFPFGSLLAPSGRTFYTADTEDGTVSVFSVGSDGRLREPARPVPTGQAAPRGLAMTPDGRFLFVSHGRPAITPEDTGPPGFVVVFAVGPQGTLSRIGKPVSVERGGNGMSVTPDGRHLYVACEALTSVSDRQLFGFSIGADGSLTPVPGSPYSAPDVPIGTAVTPDGRHLYVTSGGLNVNPDIATKVWGFAIAADGSLRPTPNAPFEAGHGPVGVALSADGRRAYVSTLRSELFTFAVGTNGDLTRIHGPVKTGGLRPLFQSVSVGPAGRPAR